MASTMPPEPGVWAADIQVVRGGHRPADQAVVQEDRHREGDVRPVAAAGIGVVVHDHVAGADLLAAQREIFPDAADIAGDRAGLQRRRLLRLGQLVVVGVDQRGAEILRFPDDRGIGHAHELVAHLDGDVLQRALQDAGGHRVDPRGRPGRFRLDVHVAPPTLMIRLPLASAVTVQSGGTTVVESVCRTIAGPANVSPTGSRSRR